MMSKYVDRTIPKGGMITISRNTYGYARVSTREQNEERQLFALRAMSIPEQNIFIDKQSGKDFERPTHCSISRASTVWDVTTRKYRISGDC